MLAEIFALEFEYVEACLSSFASSSWSEAMSAPQWYLISSSDLLHFLLVMIRSIKFDVRESDDDLVVLWILLCMKKVPPISKLLSAQKSEKSSPFSLLLFSRPSLPIMSCLPLLPLPSLAFKSPINTIMSRLGALFRIPCIQV